MKKNKTRIFVINSLYLINFIIENQKIFYNLEPRLYLRSVVFFNFIFILRHFMYKFYDFTFNYRQIILSLLNL